MAKEKLNVMVTGGTGFVGFHTVMALVNAGHSVRLLVRSPQKMQRVFAPFGLENLPYVKGDITDEASVNTALNGCNAVLHSAALVSVHASDSEKVLNNNLLGTRLVLGGAWQRGIRRMIQVSSTTALFRRGVSGVNEVSPLGTALSGYGRSKIECEKFVRDLQGEGAPIYTTYPGSIMGPNDPGMSEAMIGLRTFLKTRLLLDTTSGIQIIDVRDLAKAHLGLLERGGPPARYLMGGKYYSWTDYAGVMEEVTQKFARVRIGLGFSSGRCDWRRVEPFCNHGTSTQSGIGYLCHGMGYCRRQPDQENSESRVSGYGGNIARFYQLATVIGSFER